MRPMLLTAIVLALAGGSASSFQGKDKYPTDGIDWALSWEEATKEAIARNCPIHFAYHSTAKVCLDTAEDWKKGSIINASRNWVNCAAVKEEHETVEVTVGKEKKTWCKYFYGIPCKVHQDMAAAIGKISKEQSFTVPLSWCLDTSGKILETKKSDTGQVLASGDISTIMDKGMKQFSGPSIGYAEWKGYEKARNDFKEGMEKSEWKRAMAGAQTLQKAKTKMLNAEGKEAMNKLSEKGDELLKEAQELIATDKDKAKKQLQMIATDFKPLICSSRAADTLKNMGK